VHLAHPTMIVRSRGCPVSVMAATKRTAYRPLRGAGRPLGNRRMHQFDRGQARARNRRERPKAAHSPVLAPELHRLAPDEASDHPNGMQIVDRVYVLDLIYVAAVVADQI
jgi:hypothetical protein